MSFFSLCDGDPVVDTLRDVFGANIVRVPDEAVQPLTVIAERKGKTARRGSLGALLVGGTPPPLTTISIEPSRLADLSGKRTSKVDIDLGLKLLDGFLSGFGIPSAGINSSFKQARVVSFLFGDVLRSAIDVNLLGRALTGCALDQESPATAIFFEDNPWKLIVVDSVIQSSDFTITVEEGSDGSFALDVPAIQEYVGNVSTKLEVSSSSSTTVSFRGEQRLTFAFTAVRLFLDPDGRIRSMPPQSGLTMADYAPAHGQLHASPPQAVLSSEPAMVEWDG